MGEANEARSRGMEKLPVQSEKFPTDLLQRFLCGNTQESQFTALNGEDEEGDSEEIELNLGLSLGGRFGVDKNFKKLTRSSSVAGILPLAREDEAFTPAPVPGIVRTSSLPTETEEEWRKRKDLQTLRRMEAKRRRFEKQRSKEGEIEGLTAVNLREKMICSPAPVAFGWNSTPPPALRLPTWTAAGARQNVIGGNADESAKAKGASQCSAESQGGSSSGMSELDSKQIQGSSSYGEVRSSSQEWGNPEAAGSLAPKACENPPSSSQVDTKNPSRKLDPGENRRREAGSMSMEDMPCVFTIGDGPEGRRVEGILYKYGKGEEVRIMCVCHGKFLSPGEFVKHAGGKDVAHPLRHIVVNPNSGPFL